MNSPTTKTMQPHAAREYRPDIDGLRAVAVLGVLVFHLYPEWLPGGFLGVDVFFVISGYLITTILIKEGASGGIRLAEFWKRRIRRLLPAFAAMAIATCVIAYFFFPATLAYASGKQTLAATVGVSNWYLAALTKSYWGHLAEWAPLLHTWSLAVEEQFYLVYPFLLTLLYAFRSSRAVVVAALSLLALSSVTYAALTSPADSAKGFYLPMGRSWELLIGCLVAFAPRDAAWPMLKKQAILCGMALVGFSYLFIDGHGFMPWPEATPAVLGTAIICAFGSGSTIGSRALSLPLVNQVGRASYSLYLWHWPALVFGATLNLAMPGQYMRELCFALGLVAGFLSYIYVEPIGRTQSFIRKGAPLLVITTLFLAWGITRGPDPRYWESAGGQDAPESLSRTTSTVLLIGDSHAESLSSSLKDLSESKGWGFAQHTGLGLGIVSEIARSSEERLLAWRKADEARALLIGRSSVDVVVISCRWDCYTSEADQLAIRDKIAQWKGMNPQARFIVIGQPPVLSIGTYRAGEWARWLGDLSPASSVALKGQEARSAFLRQICEQVAAEFVSSEAALGIGGRDSAEQPILHRYHDADHLSDAGAAEVVRAIRLAKPNP